MASGNPSLSAVPDHIRNDVTALRTAPLLKLLVHFAKADGKYSENILQMGSDALLEIALGPNNPLPDESKQLYECLMNLISEGQAA